MSKQKLETCLKFWGTGNFSKELEDEIQGYPQVLPLEEYEEDGSVEWTDVEISDFQVDEEADENDEATGSFDVSFAVSKQMGCKDIEFPDHFSGKIAFLLNVKTGDFDRACEDVTQIAEEDGTEEE